MCAPSHTILRRSITAPPNSVGEKHCVRHYFTCVKAKVWISVRVYIRGLENHNLPFSFSLPKDPFRYHAFSHIRRAQKEKSARPIPLLSRPCSCAAWLRSAMPANETPVGPTRHGYRHTHTHAYTHKRAEKSDAPYQTKSPDMKRRRRRRPNMA